MCHHMLGFAGMLGRGKYCYILIFAGQGKGDVTLKIHMILTANSDLAL